MLHTPYRFRDKDDDYAPIDYTFAPSVDAGVRRRQQQNIQRGPGQANVRHVAYPEGSAIPDNPFDPPAEDEPRRSRARRAAARVQEEPAPIVTEDGSQYDPPAMPQVPEWYRVAQQNAMPKDDRRRRAPTVAAAPRYDDDAPPVTDPLGRPLRPPAGKPQPATLYEEAGYPPALLREQREWEEEQNRVNRRRRHGAQLAVPEREREAPRASGDSPSYPPAREEYFRRRTLNADEIAARADIARDVPAGRGAAYAAASYEERVRQNHHAPAYADAPLKPRETVRYPEDAEEEAPRRLQIPWLGVAAFALAIVAVGLWLLQMNFASRAQAVVEERQRQAVAIREGHPYEYRDLIEREAAKNNLNPAFVAAIVFNESSFRPGAESGVGARGLMQVMADTADSINRDLNVSGYSFDMLYDAETNVTFGCYYLGQLSVRFRGDPVLVAAAYHAGPNQVQNWLNTSTYSADGLTLLLDNLADGPTKQYAARVSRDFAIYRRLYYDRTEGDA